MADFDKNAEEMKKERRALIEDTFALKQTDRVLSASNCSYWQFLDAGYNLKEIRDDPDKAVDAFDQYCSRYHFDAYLNATTIVPLCALKEGLPAASMFVDQKGESVTKVDACCLEDDEYPELLDNETKFYWEKVMKRNFPEDFTYGQMMEVMSKFMKIGGITPRIEKTCCEKHGAYLLYQRGMTTGIENLFDGPRGIKKLSMDLRRHKKELIEYGEKTYERDVLPVLKQFAAHHTENAVCDVELGVLAHSIMNRKQFEEIYWPSLKKILDFCVENKIRLWLYTEAEVMRFTDFLQEIPKGCVVLQVESDDPIEIRRKLPNLVIAGGMPLQLLSHGTPEQCVDQAKKMIDGVGPGLILTQDKMMCTRNDAKRENLIAVNEFMQSGNY